MARSITLAVDLDVLLCSGPAVNLSAAPAGPEPNFTFEVGSCPRTHPTSSTSAAAPGAQLAAEAGSQTRLAWLRPGVRRFLLAVQPHVNTVLLVRRRCTGRRCCSSSSSGGADGGVGGGVGGWAADVGGCGAALLTAALPVIDPDGQFFGRRIVLVQDRLRPRSGLPKPARASWPGDIAACSLDGGQADSGFPFPARLRDLSALPAALRASPSDLVVATTADRTLFGGLSDQVIECQPYRKEYGKYDDVLDCLATVVLGPLLETPVALALRGLGLGHGKLEPSPMMQTLHAQVALRTAQRRGGQSQGQAASEGQAANGRQQQQYHQCGAVFGGHAQQQQQETKKERPATGRPGGSSRSSGHKATRSRGASHSGVGSGSGSGTIQSGRTFRGLPGSPAPQLPPIPELPQLEIAERSEHNHQQPPPTAAEQPPAGPQPQSPSSPISPPASCGPPASAAAGSPSNRRIAWDPVSSSEEGCCLLATVESSIAAVLLAQIAPRSDGSISAAGGGGVVRVPVGELGWRPRSFPAAAKPIVTRHMSGCAVKGAGAAAIVVSEELRPASPLAAAASAVAAATSRLLSRLMGSRRQRRCQPAEGAADAAVTASAFSAPVVGVSSPRSAAQAQQSAHPFSSAGGAPVSELELDPLLSRGTRPRSSAGSAPMSRAVAAAVAAHASHDAVQRLSDETTRATSCSGSGQQIAMGSSPGQTARPHSARGMGVLGGSPGAVQERGDPDNSRGALDQREGVVGGRCAAAAGASAAPSVGTYASSVAGGNGGVIAFQAAAAVR